MSVHRTGTHVDDTLACEANSLPKVAGSGLLFISQAQPLPFLARKLFQAALNNRARPLVSFQGEPTCPSVRKSRSFKHDQCCPGPIFDSHVRGCRDVVLSNALFERVIIFDELSLEKRKRAGN